MNIIVRLKSNSLSNLDIEEAKLIRALTDKEMIYMIKENKPDLILYEYCDGDNIESIKDINVEDTPIILVGDTNSLDGRVCSKEDINKILKSDFIEIAINKKEELVRIERSLTEEERNKEESKIDSYKEVLNNISREIEETDRNYDDENNTTIRDNGSLDNILDRVIEYKNRLQSTICSLELRNKELEDKINNIKLDAESNNMAEWFKLEFERVSIEYEKYKNDTQIALSEAECLKVKQDEYINNLINKHSNDMVMAKKASIEANKVYERLMTLYNNQCERDMRLSNEIESLNSLIEELKSAIIEKEETISSLSSDIAEKESKISELTIQTSATETIIANSIASSKAEVDNLNSKISLVNMDVESLRMENERLNRELNSSNATINSMSNASKEVEFIKERLRVVEASELELKEKVENLMKEKKTHLGIIEQKASEANALKIEISKLQSDLNAFRDTGQTGISQARNLMEEKYTGKAKIINCYGVGSSGVTTLATSLAMALSNKNVLLLDLDIMNPRCDVLLKQSPILDEVVGGEQQERTSYNLLIEKGARYVLTNINNCLIKVSPKLYYFSGVYRKINRIRLTGIDFSLFLNKLGDKFDYIVVDSGHLGVSLETDSVIKTMHNIAHKNLFISENDQFSIRGAWLKLSDTGLNMNNGLWILNMANTSKIPTEVRDKLVNVDKITIPRELGLTSRDKTFLDNMVLKSKLKEIIKKLI